MACAMYVRADRVVRPYAVKLQQREATGLPLFSCLYDWFVLPTYSSRVMSRLKMSWAAALPT